LEAVLNYIWSYLKGSFIIKMDDEARELEALEHIMSDPNAEPIKLSFGLLRSITDNFSNEIGHGGFGVVYQVWSSCI
jgi:hypothetical protein